MQNVNYTALTPLTFLERAGRYFTHQVAFDDLKGHSFTYGDLLSRSKSAAQFLINNATSEMPKVAVILDNGLASFEAHFFVPASKGVIVNLNPTLSISELISQIKQSDSEFVILSEQLFKSNEDALLSIGLTNYVCVDNSSDTHFSCAPNVTRYDDLFETQSEMLSLDQFVVDELSLIGINYTSGTTGNPKGVTFTHRSAYLQALGQCILLGLNNQSNYYFMLPMYHGNGWFQVWANVAATSKMIIPNVPHLSEMAEQMLEHGISHCAGSPRLLKNIYRMELLDRLSGLVIMTGGAAPTPQLVALSRQYGIRLIPQYGLNESCATFCVTDFIDREADELVNVFGQGVPAVHTGIGIKVVDNENNEIPKDGKSVGEILLRGNTVSAGYYRNEHETQKSFSDGWFRTGDIASVSPNGTLILKDRLKDIVFIDTPEGWLNVSTLEVERVLLTHESVKDVAVVGIDTEQSELIAFIESDDANFDISQLGLFCKDKLGRYHIPNRFIRQDLPKTVTGKIQKHILRKLLDSHA
ncbi:AMP-binding protein [Catenovulum sp. 2E275]|uniref:AMP-binding protein n=1 Tax=Catenovulum sp. 2E275 TaxID=2980497 RepID=UPI0021D0189A|nr:AMP-binding protein [Catenovulum sp. 2E275]MCU4677557.1 AMP-binding protein [Catenovulum sp. 2E275]